MQNEKKNSGPCSYHKNQSPKPILKNPTGSPFPSRSPCIENLPVGLSSHKNGDEFSSRLSHAETNTLTPVFTLSVYMRIKWFAAMQYQKNGEATI